MAEGWRPSEGDSLTGKVTSLELGSNEWGSYPIVTLASADGTETSVHCFHSVLRRQMKALRPKIGDRLTVTFEGKQPTNDGRKTVALYKVESDRPIDAEAFWGTQPEPQAVRVVNAEPGEDDIPF